MKKAGMIFFFILFTVGIVSVSTSLPNHEHPKAEGGVLDLTSWRLDQDGHLPLSGEWEFYPRQLLEPHQFAVQEVRAPRWMSVPDSWNAAFDGSEPEGQGYGTYRLTVWLDEPGSILALDIPQISTSYKLWVNGELLAGSGIVGSDAADTVPHYMPQVAYFTVPAGSAEIIVQVSNFDHVRGGMWLPLQLGTDDQISANENKGLALDLFLFGCLFIIGLYHLCLFAYRLQEKSVLYFGLFCLLQALRTLIVSQSYLLQLFPQLDWSWVLKIEYETFYLALPIAAGYIYHLFPQEMHLKMLRASQGLGLMFGVFAIFAPVYVVSSWNFVYQWITIATAVYLCIVVVKAIDRKREDASMIAIGALCYAITVMIDIFYYNEWIMKGDFASFGLLIGVFSQSFILARRFSRAFRHVEVMTERLQQMNAELEQKVAMRTADLNRMENARRQLLSDVSHDLKTPITLIQGYVEALAAGMVEEPEQQKKYLSVILSRVQGLNRLIKDLFELSKLEAGQTSFDFVPMPVVQFIHYFSARYELEVTGAGQRYEVQKPLESANSLMDKAYVKVDVHRIDQLFTNLIHNGMKYNDSENGYIKLHFQLCTDPFGSEGTLLIEVEDNGPGIDPEDIPKIFDRFYKGDKTRNTSVGGSGLGLAIVKEIASRHGGEVGVKSAISEGSTFYVRLPIYWEDQNEPSQPTLE